MNKLKLIILVVAFVGVCAPVVKAEPVYNSSFGWFSEYTGQWYVQYDDFRKAETVTLWGSGGPQVQVSKRQLTNMSGYFGVMMSGILVFALFKSVL